MAGDEGSRNAASFVHRHPLLYAARVALVCTAIMVVAKTVGAWLDDESVSVARVLRFMGGFFTVVFLMTSGFILVAKRRGELK